MESKSGREIGAENVSKLLAYLACLKDEGSGLPMRGGRVNRTAIAISCGFDRGVFHQNEEAKRILEEAEKTLGHVEAAETNAQVVAQQHSLDLKDRRIRTLEERIATRETELYELRKRVDELQRQLTRFQIIEEHLTQTGRRVIP